MKRGNIECMRFLAVFMITLVISIPFLTSNAYATLTVVSANGQDGIAGIMGPKDKLNATVKVSTSQSVFTTDDVMILENMGLLIAPFTSCEVGIGGYNCNYLGSEETRTPGLKKFCACEAAVCPVSSTLCPSQSQYSKDIMIKVDGIGPTVTSASVDKIFISKEDPKVSFGIIDTIGGGASGCSGIKQVEIYVDGSLYDTEEVDTPGETCAYNINNYNINNSDLPNGEIVICALPEDVVGNVQAEYREFLDSKDGAHCVGLTKDDRPPIFSSAQIFDPTGTTELTMISSKPTPALLEVKLNTFTHVLAGNQITADLTELGAGTTMMNCAGYQKPGDNVSMFYNCSSTITIQISEAGSKSINLTAEDVSGNKGSAVFPFSFSIDDFGPLVFDIMTDKPYFGTYLLGPTNNTVSFLIQEEGSGINNESITVSDGTNQLTEVSCGIHEFYGAACVIEEYNPPASASSVTFTISGADLAGNPLDITQIAGKNIIRVDRTAPEFRNATVVGQGPVVTEGSTVMILAYMTDHYGFDVNGANVEAKFDFAPDTESYFPAEACNPVVEIEEEIPEEEEEEEQSWEDQSGWDGSNTNVPDGGSPQEEEPIDKTWECFWTIPGVVNQGPNRPMTAMFKIRDLANNLDVGSQAPVTQFFFQFMDPTTGAMWYGEEESEIEIYGFDPTIEGSWTVDIDMPVPHADIEGVDMGVIDATVAAVTPYRMWYPITVRSLTSGIEAISVTLKKDINGMPCYGDFFMTYGDAEQTNMQPMIDGDLLHNSLEVVFLPSQFIIDADADYMPFSAECAVGVISKRSGGDAISIEMIVPFNVTGAVHPYDDVADKVHDKIMDHYNWFLDEENTFTKIVMILQDIINFLTSVCEVYSMLSALNVAIGAIDNTLGVFAQGVKVLEGLSKGLNAINMGMEKFFKVIDVVASPVCSFLMCSKFNAAGRLPDETYSARGNADLGAEIKGKQKENDYGGTMPWCDVGYQALVEATTVDVGGAASVILQTKKISMFPNDIKQSLVLSILCICIPGILNGLMTWRNIECEYIECLYKDSTMNTQLYICDELYSYSMCKYFVGEIFEMLPFAKALETILQGLADFLKNPLAWILGAAAIACEFAVPGDSTSYLVCQAMDLVFQVAEAYNRVKEIVQRIQYWAEVGITGGGIPDKCEKIIKLLNDDPRYFGDEPEPETGTEDDPGYGADAGDVDGEPTPPEEGT